MSGPLTHFMPVLRPHRPGGDPYFPFVSFLSEWRGRPDGTFAAATADMNLPQDKSHNNLPLSISGTPHRFPLDTDGISPALRGVSDQASYQFDQVNQNGSAIVVHDNGPIELGDQNFEIYVKFRTQDTDAWNLCGRWGTAAGSKSWTISYYKALKKLRFTISIDGTTVSSSHGIADFRLGDIDDGVTLAQMTNNLWHEVRVTRVSNIITINLDGFNGSTEIDTVALGSGNIWSPAPDVALLNIGSVSADAISDSINTSFGNFQGFIKEMTITIADVVELDVDFSEYWGMWWVGNYPQTLWPTSVQLQANTFQNETGLKKFSAYTGNKFPYNEHFNFLSSDFTIELFDARINYIEDEVQTLLAFGWPTYKSWRILTKNQSGTTAPGHLIFQYSLNNSTIFELTFLSGMASNDEFFGNLTVSRKGNTIRLYIDGQLVSSGSISGALFSGAINSIPLSFFSNMNNTDPVFDNARILAIRLTKGIGRYSGPFYRVPSLPLPKSVS